MSEDPRFVNYPETVLELKLYGLPTGSIVGRFRDARARIDLRQPIDAEARRVLRRAGLAHSFAVITACNPRGLQLDDAANRERTVALLARIARLGLVAVPTDGLSPDGTHREEGVAVNVDIPAAASIARDFQQTAFFWFDGSIMWIIMADATDERIRLPIDTR
jgi:Protein of unknown function (DUF3293)